MNSERIKSLEQLIKEDPTDPFPLYALALEVAPYSPSRSVNLIESLLANFPDYLPGYYQAALIYLDLQHDDKAIAILAKGIDLAKLTNEMKTLGELKSLLEQVME